MKKIVALVLAMAMTATGCASAKPGDTAPEAAAQNSGTNGTEAAAAEGTSAAPEASAVATITGEMSDAEASEFGKTIVARLSELNTDDVTFDRMDDPALLRYLDDEICCDMDYALQDDDYHVESVRAIFVPKEYLEGLNYESAANIFFGITMAELDQQFTGTRYIFVPEENETTVSAFEAYDEAYANAIKNAAGETGVILLGVTASITSLGPEAPAIGVIFATSAGSGTEMVSSGALYGGIAAATVKGIQNKNMKAVPEVAALGAGENFKWSAIGGTLADGLGKPVESRSIHTPGESERQAAESYAGDARLSYQGGQEMPYNTPGVSRPDVSRTFYGSLEAIEVKNYNLNSERSIAVLYSELSRQVSARAMDLPQGSLQRVVLDIRGRKLSKEQINDIVIGIKEACDEAYPNIPVDLLQ